MGGTPRPAGLSPELGKRHRGGECCRVTLTIALFPAARLRFACPCAAIHSPLKRWPSGLIIPQLQAPVHPLVSNHTSDTPDASFLLGGLWPWACTSAQAVSATVRKGAGVRDQEDDRVLLGDSGPMGSMILFPPCPWQAVHPAGRMNAISEPRRQLETLREMGPAGVQPVRRFKARREPCTAPASLSQVPNAWAVQSTPAACGAERRSELALPNPVGHLYLCPPFLTPQIAL